MPDLDKLIFEINEAARAQSRELSLVYLRERGAVGDLDTCTDLELLHAAIAQLLKDREELGRALDRVSAIERRLTEVTP